MNATLPPPACISRRQRDNGLRKRRFRTTRLAEPAFVLLCAAAVSSAAAPIASAADRGPQILQQVLERYSQSISKIDDYTVTQQIAGTPSTTYFEKKVVDGHAAFAPVTALSVMQERLDTQRLSFGRAALTAGLSALAPETSGASYGQMGSFVSSLETLGLKRLGGGAGAGDKPLEAVRHVLVQGATQAGLQKTAKGLGAASADQLQMLAGALSKSPGKGILAQLGKIALGQVKRLAADSFTRALGAASGGALGGLAEAAARRGLGASGAGGNGSIVPTGGPGGLARTLGGAGGLVSPGAGPAGLVTSGGGPAGLVSNGGLGSLLGGVGDLGQQAVGRLAQAGLGALMGGLGAIAARAMTPDLSQLDNAAGRPLTPDLHELLRSLGDNVRLVGSSKLDGHKVWTLKAQDASRLALPNSRGFTADDVTLDVDRKLYVARRIVVSGKLRAQGKTVPVKMETRLSDYREIHGMAYPFHTVTSVAGVSATLSPEQRRQAAQMPADMQARMKQAMAQLRKLPPQQRAMAEKMLQQQMPQLQQMMKQSAALAGGDTAIVVDVQDVAVNTGRPAALQAWSPSK